jgi:hypothetical protein
MSLSSGRIVVLVMASSSTVGRRKAPGVATTGR